MWQYYNLNPVIHAAYGRIIPSKGGELFSLKIILPLRASEALGQKRAKIILNSYLPARNQIIILMSLQPAALPETPSSPQTPSHPYFSFTKTAVSNVPAVLVEFVPVRWEGAIGEGVSGEGASAEFKAWPVFNDDRRFFTPCFMLHQDKVRTPYNLPAFLTLHEARMQELAQEREEMLVARPSKTNSFCCVCRSFFDDYLEHVARPDHVASMRQNKFCGDIQTLCNRFDQGSTLPKGKVKPIRKQLSRKAQRGTMKELIRSSSTEASPVTLGDILS